MDMDDVEVPVLVIGGSLVGNFTELVELMELNADGKVKMHYTEYNLASINTALEQNQSFGLLAIIGLLWAGLGLFSNVTASLDLIFRVPTSRSLWRQRLVAVAMILVLIVLVTASFVTSGILTLISAMLVSRPSIWVSVASVFLPLGVNMMIFVLLFRFVPARRGSTPCKRIMSNQKRNSFLGKLE